MNLLDYVSSDLTLPIGKFNLVKEIDGVFDFQMAYFRNVQAADLGSQRLGLESGTVTRRAGPVAPPTTKEYT
tara:strand:- start:22 stop:237 length:216 start_codon:yes stop_codon:yes gene_type:complete